MNYLQKVIDKYGMSIQRAEQITKKLYRIQTDYGDFALKQSRYHSNEENKWNSIVDWLEANGGHLAPPLARTKNSRSYVKSEEWLYYLTPWVQHTKDEYPSHDIESFYRSLGILHKQTKQTSQDNYHYIEYLGNRKEASEQAHQQLLVQIEGFEKRRYMSPLGLAVCSQYKQIHYSLEFMKDLFREFPDRENISGEIPQVMNHGNLKNDHIIQYHGHSYFLNWEQMFVGPAMLDVSRFFLNDFRFHDSPVEAYSKKFHVYEQLYGITNQERLFLAIHLIDPHHYFHRLDQLTADEHSSELEKVQRLEKSFRRMVYGRVIAESLFSSFQAQQVKENESISTPDETQ
ncbi:hypothetical protein [Thalassobacillus devorans]|uniref:hypothetical protein n=1 Tax=Thalassobacillus devorans TaxID=279813 RepID=UPI0004907B1F|nr:hypothetical protein [Thalassobacillus devorans]